MWKEIITLTYRHQNCYNNICHPYAEVECHIHKPSLNYKITLLSINAIAAGNVDYILRIILVCT